MGRFGPDSILLRAGPQRHWAISAVSTGRPASLRSSHRSRGSTVASGRRAGVRVKLPSPLTSARRISGERPDLSASHVFVADGTHPWLHNFQQLDSLILVDSFTLQRLRRIVPAGSRVDQNRRPTFDLGFVDASIWNSMTRGVMPYVRLLADDGLP